MKSVYLLLFIINARLACIYAMRGGEFRPIREAPYQAQIFILNKNSTIAHCGAAILSEYWLISTAQCMRFEEESVAIATIGSGSLEEKRLKLISKIIVHKNYDHESFDICLHKVENPIEFNEYRQPIAVSNKSPKEGDLLTVFGFSQPNDNNIYKAAPMKVGQAPVIKDAECRERQFMCTNSSIVGLCTEDSGSPAVFDGKLVGLVKGIFDLSCGNSDLNIFIEVSRFYDWIIKSTGIEYED